MREYFKTLFGNEATKSRLGELIVSGRVPHAFLIDGPRGSGKYTFALSVAAALNCEKVLSDSHPLPCLECNVCKRIYSGEFTDVKVLEKDKGRATLGVDAVKEFKADMFLSATEAEKKVYIIKDAESMTTEAQNSLLTVLEEPPKNVVTLLLANGSDRIINTIKSRAQYVPMSRFSSSELDSALTSLSDEYRRLKRIEPEAIGRLFVLSDGVIGRALELLDPKMKEEADEIYSDVEALTSCIVKSSPYKDLYAAIENLGTARQEIVYKLELTLTALRDLMIVKNTQSFTPLFYPSAEYAQALSAKASVSKLGAVYELITETIDALSKNANSTSLLRALGAKLKNL